VKYTCSMDEGFIRAAKFRAKAIAAEARAEAMKIEEIKRAWMTVARDWHEMADREEQRLSL
jgi:hypothetical protein